MADNMTFPIQFDLEKGVNDAIKDWNDKYADKLEMADNLIFRFDLEAAVKAAQGDADRLLRRLYTTINSKPLAVNLKIDGAGSGSINEINSRLRDLVKQWNNRQSVSQTKRAASLHCRLKRLLQNTLA